MKRREFLSAGLGAVTSSLLTVRFGHARVAPERKKIVVIGAGLAGLVAAYELRELNFDVTVLEAQSRSGGRVLTLRTFSEPGVYAEAGAARIPADHDLTLKYVSKFALPLDPFYPATGKFMRVRGDRVERVGWDKFEDAISMLIPLNDRDGWKKIRGGNDRLPHAFASKLGSSVHYDSPVVRIEQDPSGVSVKFKEKGRVVTVEGDFVICAIPFTMLAKVEVWPMLSAAKMQSINELEYDSASRAFIETKNRFWRTQDLNGYALGEDAAEVWESTFEQTGTHGILQNYLRGGYALDLMKKSEPDRIELTLQKLEKLFPEIRANLVKGFAKCWSEDPWVLGAWAHPTTNTLTAGRRPEGRMFFAGEHLSDRASWMQGALQSGLRVVNEVASAPATI